MLGSRQDADIPSTGKSSNSSSSSRAAGFFSATGFSTGFESEAALSSFLICVEAILSRWLVVGLPRARVACFRHRLTDNKVWGASINTRTVDLKLCRRLRRRVAVACAGKGMAIVICPLCAVPCCAEMDSSRASAWRGRLVTDQKRGILEVRHSKCCSTPRMVRA
jgi:hypothetical protein